MTRTTASFSRRSLLGLLGAAGAGTALAACAGPGSNNSGEPSAVATGEARGEVSFAHWRAEDTATFDELIATFTQQFPDISVTQDITGSNDYQSQALNRLRGASVGDVFPTFRGAQFQQFVDAGVYTDLGATGLADTYNPTLIQVGNAGGTQYGLPYQVVFPMPIANTSLLEAAGVSEAPQSWDAWLDMLDKLKGSGVIPLAWPGADVGNAGQLINTMAMNEMPSEDAFARIETGEVKVTEDWFLTVLGKFGELGPYMQPNAAGAVAEPTMQLFATEEAALLVTGSWQTAGVRELGAEFPMELVPPITSDSDPTYVGAYNATFILGINADSDVQPAGLEWLRFLSDPANAGTYANATAQHVTVADVEYTNEDLKAYEPWLTAETMLAPRFQFNDLDIRTAVEEACFAAVGGTSPEEAAEKAQATIDQRI